MLEQIFENLQYNFSIEAAIVLLILIFLEAILSADNAIALAAIAQGLEDKKLERQALNFGLVVAYVLRITLLLTATWVQKYWQFELIGAAYLLWLVFQHFTTEEDEEGGEHTARYASLWQVIPVIAFTDLAFSLDSVTTAIAVSDTKLLVITGTTIGIITLRLFSTILKIKQRLQSQYTVSISVTKWSKLTLKMPPFQLKNLIEIWSNRYLRNQEMRTGLCIFLCAI